MKNNPQVVSSLNSAIQAAQRAVEALARGKPDAAQELNTIKYLSKALENMDARLVAIEEKLAKQE